MTPPRGSSISSAGSSTSASVTWRFLRKAFSSDARRPVRKANWKRSFRVLTTQQSSKSSPANSFGFQRAAASAASYSSMRRTIAHVVTQRWFDKREGGGEVADLGELEAKRQSLEKTPALYALMPLFPLALLLIFNKFVWGVSMNVATAMFIAWILAFLIDVVARRDVRKSFDLSYAMFKDMGSILTSTVGLIFVAAFFAKGLQNIGIVSLLLSGAEAVGLGYTGTSVVMSAIVGVVTVLTGSGVAAFTSLGHLIQDAAKAFGENGVSMMMHTASEMLRAMSPVAGVIIIVSGFAKVNPLTMVKRTIIPCLTGYVVMLLVVAAFF